MKRKEEGGGGRGPRFKNVTAGLCVFYPFLSENLTVMSQGAYPISAGQSSENATAAPQPQSRQAAEEARKDRTLAEFMLMLDDYEPLVSSCPPCSLLLANHLLDSQRSNRLLPSKSRL